MAFNNASNVELWNAIRAKYPQFASHTSEGTVDTFTERGFTALTTNDPRILSDFFNLTMRVYLQLVRTSLAEDPLAEAGFGEVYDTPWGGYIQRMYVHSMKPVTPVFKNLVQGGTIDPFVINKPNLEELFFVKNFDYQAMMTIPDTFNFKQIFVAENGYSEVMAGFMQGLQNAYITQRYLNKLETLNAGMNSTDYPLNDNQKIPVPLPVDSTEATDEQLQAFILTIKNAITALRTPTQNGAFNQMGYVTTQSKDRLKLLIRQGWANAFAVRTFVGAYNPDYLTLGVDIIEVPNFGGMVPYQDAEFTTRAYPVYNNFGAVIGFNTTDGATTVTIPEEDVFYQDPNENVIAILADRGVIFESITNPYEVQTIYNPRGMYTNYFANSPDNAISYDHSFNLIQFIRTDEPAANPVNVQIVNTTDAPVHVETQTAPANEAAEVKAKTK